MGIINYISDLAGAVSGRAKARRVGRIAAEVESEVRTGGGRIKPVDWVLMGKRLGVYGKK